MAGGSEMDGSDHLIALRDGGFTHHPVEVVAIDTLTASYSPRLAGEDADHAQALAGVQESLPPILVHRETLTVIDGMHRLRAAQICGRSHIEVRFFDGDAKDAVLLAVALNTAQGMALSPADRAVAAARILVAHPTWSDRAVAAVAGLSAGKVSQIRASTVEEELRSQPRVGRDGRSRPVNPAQGRQLAYELMQADPGASLRQIARQAGIAPGTVSDVRDRMRRGVDPVSTGHQELAEPDRLWRRPSPAPRRPPTPPRPPEELRTLSNALRSDPSLRSSELGRLLLRLFETCAVVEQERQKIVIRVPAHCKGPMSELIHGYAEIWRSFAEELQAEGPP
jgi:ParB-like chromosome segregation protein Spo0J